MSATGDLVIAIQEHERAFDLMDDERLSDFIRSYTKDKTPLDEQRASHAHRIDEFNQMLSGN